MFFAMATFLGFLGLYIPSFYIQIYAAEHSVRENLVVYLLAIMNSGGVLGRIVCIHVQEVAGCNLLISFRSLGVLRIGSALSTRSYSPEVHALC